MRGSAVPLSSVHAATCTWPRPPARQPLLCSGASSFCLGETTYRHKDRESTPRCGRIGALTRGIRRSSRASLSAMASCNACPPATPAQLTPRSQARLRLAQEQLLRLRSLAACMRATALALALALARFLSLRSKSRQKRGTSHATH
eukprot:3517173-Rhodomonas_salina.1